MRVFLLAVLAVVATSLEAQAGITTDGKTSTTWTGSFEFGVFGETDTESGGVFTHLDEFTISSTIGAGAKLDLFGSDPGQTFEHTDTAVLSGSGRRGVHRFEGVFTSQSDPTYVVDYEFDVDFDYDQTVWQGVFSFNASAAAVPEPGTMGFLALVGAGFGGSLWRRRRKAKGVEQAPGSDA